jgi:transaldolase
LFVQRHSVQLTVKLFADGADLDSIAMLARDPSIRGFTTNPTLMRKAGITDYKKFALDALALVGDRPISFEVFADEFPDMRRQALQIAGWGSSVYVKIPIMTSAGLPSVDLIRDLSREGVQLNITAVFTLEQVAAASHALAGGAPSVVSVFAGRIADAGHDPVPHMAAASAICRSAGRRIELLWASPRELLNIVQADRAGCDIITATPELLAKLPLLGKDLHEFSRETVMMFKQDAERSGYAL